MKGHNDMKTTTATQFQIDNAYQELSMREAAAGHLNGIPARQNLNAISRLYDRLTSLNIAKIEQNGGAN